MGYEIGIFEKLKTIVEMRDVTPDKLKNASNLQIEVPKLVGIQVRWISIRSKVSL